MPTTNSSTLPLPYTSSPYLLFISDLLLWFRITFVVPPAGIPSIILPFYPYPSGALDELYPNIPNLTSIIYHVVLLFVQGAFLLSLIPAALFAFSPPFVGVFTVGWFGYVALFVLVNYQTSVLLNGKEGKKFVSEVELSRAEMRKMEKEKWIFVNGVAAGEHWIQSCLDGISIRFRREVEGIQNPTRGILFDLFECLLERTLSFATISTRTVYARMMEIVSNDRYERIVMILHSQGTIQGGLALDWLFATVPAEQMKRVEVYTFGSAASHFNNPVYSRLDEHGVRFDEMSGESDGRVIKHIEHYANEGDYVSQFGVLRYRPTPMSRARARAKMSVKSSWKLKFGLLDQIEAEEAQNRYVGRLFIRKGSGHQFNKNYLDEFFRMDPNLTRVEDNNEFMDMVVDQSLLESCDIVVDQAKPDGTPSKKSVTERDENEYEILSHSNPAGGETKLIAKELSRLWLYRNGGSPD